MRHAKGIDYRHLVAALQRKPGAFARWVLRDAAFPRQVYKRTWERLAAGVPEREACRDDGWSARAGRRRPRSPACRMNSTNSSSSINCLTLHRVNTCSSLRPRAMFRT